MDMIAKINEKLKEIISERKEKIINENSIL